MKIRGITVGTPTSPERILCTPQELTEAQKAQARKNIGAAAVGEGGGGIAPLIVTIDETGSRVTHTAAQIHEHAVSGCDVWFEDSGNYIALTLHTPTHAQFSTIGTNYSVQTYTVYDDGTYEYVEDTLASGDDVATVVGDIEAALDEIIALQNELIGGDEE